MTQREYEAWIAYYRLFPFDDRHRFHRPAALIAGSLGGGDIDSRIQWLQPEPDTGHTSADMDLFKAAGMKLRRKPQ